jgi:cyanate permease
MASYHVRRTAQRVTLTCMNQTAGYLLEGAAQLVRGFASHLSGVFLSHAFARSN